MLKTKVLATVMVAIMTFSGLAIMLGAEDNDASGGNYYVYGMGKNASGQQGDGTTTDVTTPTQIGSTLGTITKVVCSTDTTFIITSDGKLYGMGDNTNGQQGNGTTTNVTTPTQIGSTLGNITDVVCSTGTTFIITSDGKLYGMGDGSNGQMGNGTTTIVKTPTQIGSTLGTITKVVCSAQDTFFLTSDGKLYGMGLNLNGQQGDGTTTDVKTPTQIGSTLGNITDVVCSSNTTFFLTSDGKLYGMGKNANGQQGDGTTTDVKTPTQIGSTLGNITDVVCSFDTVFFLLPALTDVTFLTVDADVYGGSLSANSIADVDIGSTITVSGNSVTIGDTSITATTQPNTAQYSYGVNWSVEDGDTVTADMTITATFTRSVNTYAVSLSVDPSTDWGDLSAAAFPNEEYGSTVTIGTDTITIGEDTITATPDSADAQYTYAVDGFYIGDTKLTTGYEITGATSVTVKFARTVNVYTITWDMDYDSITATTQVAYGDTPSYTPEHRTGYTFEGWDPTPVPVTEAATYTAQWEAVLTVTITFVPGEGTLNGSETETYNVGYAYGELPTCTPRTNYDFTGWWTAAEGGTQITEESIVPDVDTTLYAQYEPTSMYAPVKTIIDMIPLIIAAALLLVIIVSALYYRK